MEQMQNNLNRRAFLKTTGVQFTAAALAAAGLGSICQQKAHGKKLDADDQYDFLMARVKFDCNMRVNDNWNAFPGGDSNLLKALEQVVRCRVKPMPGCGDRNPRNGREQDFNAVADLTDINELRKYPFLFMTASGSYTLTKEKKSILGKYLTEGGFIYMDDCVHGVNDDKDYFFQSSYKTLEDIFGRGSVKPVPNSHEIFHNVYDLGDIGMPHVIGQPHPAHAITVGSRIAAFLSSTDIHCGWVDRNRQWFGSGGKMGIGKHGHEEAIKIGVNIIMYAISH